MPRGLNNWKFIEIERFLKSHGFRHVHTDGSHFIYTASVQGIFRQVCVPFHGNKSIHPKTMKSIVVQSGLLLNIWLKR